MQLLQSYSGQPRNSRFFIRACDFVGEARATAGLQQTSLACTDATDMQSTPVPHAPVKRERFQRAATRNVARDSRGLV
jgi:hypothetical protein